MVGKMVVTIFCVAFIFIQFLGGGLNDLCSSIRSNWFWEMIQFGQRNQVGKSSTTWCQPSLHKKEILRLKTFGFFFSFPQKKSI